MVAGTEACDDGNTANGDGCSNMCAKECASLQFNGANQAVAANPAGLSPTSVTLSAWYNVATGTPFGTIAMKKGKAGGGPQTYALSVGPTGVSARLQTGLNNFLDNSTAAGVPDNNWHMATVSYDAATGVGKLYVDGNLAANKTQGTGLFSEDPTQPFSLGAASLNAGFEGFLTGSVANVVIYDHALTDAEVSMLLQGVYPQNGQLAFYPTNEGMGLSSADASGNGHDLTVPANGWTATDPFCGGAAAICGNGTLEGAEACDDGNTAIGDGCSNMCTKECASLQFNGANQAVAANPAGLSPTSVTLAAFYKVATGTPFGTIAMKKGKAGGGPQTYALSVGPTGVSSRLQTGLNTFLDNSSALGVPDNNWHMAAVTYDAATGVGKLFVDGNLVANKTQGTGLFAEDPTQPFSVGAASLNAGFEGFLTGSVTNVVIYDRALTDAEIVMVAQGIYPQNGQIAFYPTNEGMGLSSADISGNGHNLTVPANGWDPTDPFCK